MNQENLLNKIRQKDAKAFTHGGKFHADDIFSSAESASRCFAEQRGADFLMYYLWRRGGGQPSTAFLTVSSCAISSAASFD